MNVLINVLFVLGAVAFGFATAGNGLGDLVNAEHVLPLGLAIITAATVLTRIAPTEQHTS